jgi:hypothetical protein
MSETNAQGNLVPANLGAKPVVVETKAEPTLPNADTALEAIKARVKAANPHLEVPNLPYSLKKPVAVPVPEVVKPGDKPAELDIKPNDKAVLSELAKAQANLREATSRMKELEAKAVDGEYGTKVKKLWGGSDQEKLQLLGELSGKDPTEALADLVEIFYNTKPDGSTADPAAKPGDRPANDPILAKLDAMAKELAELKAAPAKQAQALSQEQLQQGTRAFLKSQVTKLGLEISSRAENQDEAVDKALSFAPTVVQELQLDPASLTPEQAEQVAAESIKRAEAEFEKLGQRFGKVQAQPKPSIYDKPISRAAPRLDMKLGDTKPVPYGKGWTDYVEQVKSAWEHGKA